MVPLPESLTCPRCGNTAPPRLEPHAAGRTFICRQCGNSLEVDHAGQSYPPPENPDHLRGNPTFGAISYPLGLACTSITLHPHISSIRVLGSTLTPSKPNKTITFLVYHQPFPNPNLSFRDVRRRADTTVRYIYAIEIASHDPVVTDLPSPEMRKLTTLIVRETCTISGYTIRDRRGSRPIYPPGTILATPLAPAH